MAKSQRIFYYDLLRLMAIIGIIFCHTAVYFVIGDMGSINFYISSFYDCLRDFSVPVFVMLSGALLLMRKDSLIPFFKKRLSRILIPFIFWAFMYVIYSYVYIRKSAILEDAINIFLGKGNTFGVIFWFVWMIIIVYIAIFIINKAVERFGLDKKFMDLLAVLSVLYIILTDFHIISLPFLPLLTYFASFISYAIIGYFLSNNSFIFSKISSNKAVLILAVSSLLLYSYYICTYVVPQSMMNSGFVYLGYFTVIILAISTLVFLLFKYLDRTEIMSRFKKSKYGQGVTLLSQYSYGIYLDHYLILHLILLILNPYLHITSFNSIIAIPVIVILVFAISVIILCIMDKIPILNKFNGKN